MLRETILKLIDAGISKETFVRAAGISQKTFYNFLKEENKPSRLVTNALEKVVEEIKQKVADA